MILMINYRFTKTDAIHRLSFLDRIVVVYFNSEFVRWQLMAVSLFDTDVLPHAFERKTSTFFLKKQFQI